MFVAFFMRVSFGCRIFRSSFSFDGSFLNCGLLVACCVFLSCWSSVFFGCLRVAAVGGALVPEVVLSWLFFSAHCNFVTRSSLLWWV